MEATPPKLRFVAIFEYGIGWGLGQMMVPFINDWTKDYRLFLLVLLLAQLLLLPYLYWGVHESIRWLISEADINRAQIELRRACKWNRKTNGAQLAQKIAQVQVQQLRKASCVIETKLAPMRLAEQQQVSQELDALSSTIRRSIALNSGPPNEFQGQRPANGLPEVEQPSRRLSALSPTLARQSFSMASSAPRLDRDRDHQLEANHSAGSTMAEPQVQLEQSLTTQAFVQLALKHSNAIQQQEEGSLFLVRMFHRKLWRMTILLMLISVMLETTYYSLIQANGIVGNDINLNYYSGAVIEWIGAFMFILVLWAFNRRLALILPTLSASLACIGIALSYHLIPDSADRTNKYLDTDRANITGLVDQPGSLVVNDTLPLYLPAGDELMGLAGSDRAKELLLLREQVNFWLMILAKLSITVAIQIGAVIAMEAYPNNLRQSGSGAIVFVGRIGSIVAPFLINDNSPERTTFKLTLASLALIGIIISAMVPCFLPDNKDQELCDRLNEIPDTNEPDPR